VSHLRDHGTWPNKRISVYLIHLLHWSPRSERRFALCTILAGNESDTLLRAIPQMEIIVQMAVWQER
jgi:hypothetical protein